MKKYILLTLALLTFSLLNAQFAGVVKGIVLDAKTREPLSFVNIKYEDVKTSETKGVLSDEKGQFEVKLTLGTYLFTFTYVGYREEFKEITLEPGREFRVINLQVDMEPPSIGPPVITIVAEYPQAGKMHPVSGTTIAAGKKNDVIYPQNSDANLAQNNTRQIFARVPGLMIWENDGNGTGTSIAARGLSPNRSWEFNNRQNGYDMSSDAFGYPEAYYVPPAEALGRVEIIRGAASLQFGPQLGGMVNYVIQEGTRDKALRGRVSLSGGSYGMGNAFASLGGTKGKMNYYGFYNYRRADGWRENSAYFTNTGYVNVNWLVNQRLTIGMQFTGMHYQLQQPGGLTDSLFAADHRASFRERNWFTIRWNMPAVTADYRFDNKAQLSAKLFGLFGERSSVGYTGAANTTDPGTARTIDRDFYTNYGAEVRYLTPFQLLGKESFVSTGLRYYRGNTQREQGKGTDGSDADYTYTAALTRDLDLNAENMAAFAEVLLQLTKKLKVVPGVRYEYIRTSAEGTPALQREERTNGVPLFGAGAEYNFFGNSTSRSELLVAYANWAQSFRPATFNDVWTNQPAVRIDQNLGPVKGQNMDIGIRGEIFKYFFYDVNAFFLLVDGRIGDVSMTDENGNPYLFRTNTGNSTNSGVEWYVEFKPYKIPYRSPYDGKNYDRKNPFGQLSIFTAGSHLEAWYTGGANEGKRVEYAPRWNVRAGLMYRYKAVSASFNWNYIDDVYTDARNSAVNAAGTAGPLPSYQLLDFGCTVTLPKNVVVKAAVNNIADVRYATRRAGGYPGPGIIPGEGRTAMIGVTMNF